jgi:hypothetical protein
MCVKIFALSIIYILIAQNKLEEEATYYVVSSILFCCFSFLIHSLFRNRIVLTCGESYCRQRIPSPLRTQKNPNLAYRAGPLDPI